MNSRDVWGHRPRIQKWLVILAVSLLSPLAQAQHPLEGLWKFTSLRYRDQILPPPNPSLNLYFSFNSQGRDRLFWSREGEKGFCEREALYELKEGYLEEEVVWVNPQNNPDCAKDLDMQVGRKTRVRVHIHQDQIETDLPFADETLTYIWSKVPPNISEPGA